MRRSLVRTLIAAPVAVASAAALVACSSGSSTQSTTPTSAAAGSAALHDALPQSIKDAGVIKFAGDSHPPYRVVAADGKTVTGIDKDFQDAIGKVLGVSTQVEIVAGLPAALQGMLANRYDAFNGPVQATAEREKQFDSITWMTTRTSYVVPAGSAAEVKSSDDLCGKRVAVTAGSVVEGQLKKLSDYCQGKGRAAAESIGLADTNATLLAVTSGRADAAGMTQAAAIDVTAKEQGKWAYVTQTEEQGATVDNLALLVPKSSGLGPVMLNAYKELFSNGEYQRIMTQHNLTNVMVAEPKLNVASSGKS
jgi:polar amino acid transport system substrate-binding protein